MTGKNGNASVNSQVKVDENAEKTKKGQSRNLVREFVTPFVELKLAGKNGGAFYSQAKTSKGDIGSDFLAHWKSKDEWNNLSLEEKKILETLEKSLFLKEVVRIGAGVESKRDALVSVLDREFTLAGAQKKSIVSEIKSFSLSDLSKHLGYRTTRQEFIDRTFPKKETQPVGLDFKKQFEAVFEKKNISLDENQKESVTRLLASSHVSEQDVEAILPFFTKLEEKQLLVKFFLPTITLAALEEMGILSKQQVHGYIRKCVDSQMIGQDFSIEDELIESVDPNEIILPTSLLPETDLDRLLAGKGKKAIINQIEETNQEIAKEYESGNTLGLVPDEDGKLLPAFQEKLKALGIANSELFAQGSYIRGKVKQADGTFQSFHVAITGIDDDPAKNRANGGTGKQITVKNILTSDGSVDKNWNKKPGELYSYSDIYTLLTKSKKEGNPEIMSQTMLDSQVEKGEMKEKVLRSDIDTLSELNNALDTIDQAGKKHPLQKGSSVQVGKPGDKDFWVFQVKSINENSKTIALTDGTSQEILSFQDFFDNFETREGLRLPNMETPEDFLKALQEYSPKKNEFEDIIFDTNRGFIPSGEQSNKDFPSIVQFSGSEEMISMFDGIDPSGSGWTRGEWEIKEKKDNKGAVVKRTGKYKSGASQYHGGWNALFAHFLDTKAIPVRESVPVEAPDKRDSHVHMHQGFIKRFLGNPSFHDMVTGAKGLIDFVKHKLEHGSKLQSAKFQLALGKMLPGFDEAKMRELRNEVHLKGRELMEKMVKELTDLPTGERATEVLHILTNKGSHDYEIQAAVLAMLKKHGTLYVGVLQQHQGSFLFLERITGQKYDKNSHLIKSLMAKAAERGVPPREEFLIQSYVQRLGNKDGGYGCDWGLWGQVRSSWEEGIKNEKESGEKQAGQGYSLDQRLFVVHDKFQGGEISQGIGAMGKVWGKGGGSDGGPKMHLPAMYIALSNIPKTLHTNQTNELYNEFKTNGHPYPALAFLHREEKVELFQRVVKKLCANSGDPKMIASYASIETYRKSNKLKETINAIRSFWDSYGVMLHKKLVMSQDPEILFLSQQGDKDCQEYVGHMKGFTHNLAFNKGEIEENAYEYGHSSWTWDSSEFLRKNIQINPSSGVLSRNDPATKMAWDSFIAAVKDLRNVRVTDDAAKNRAFQLERFTEYYKAFNKMLINIPPEKFGTVESQPYMKDLMNLGFRKPTTQQEGEFEKPEYMRRVTEDFEAYMRNEKSTTARHETETVATSISDLLRTPPANDAQVKKAA